MSTGGKATKNRSSLTSSPQEPGNLELLRPDMNNRKKFLLAVSSALLMIGTADSKDRIENSPSVLVLMDRYAWDGVVHGLSAGDYLAVRSGPGVNYSQLDKLYLKS